MCSALHRINLNFGIGVTTGIKSVEPGNNHCYMLNKNCLKVALLLTFTGQLWKGEFLSSTTPAKIYIKPCWC